MNETLLMIATFVGGIALGIIFFGGLWFTVKKIISSKTPGLLMVGSFILRITIVLAGFYFIGLGDWKKLIACLTGFMVARFTVIYLTKSVDEKNAQIKKEVAHEA
jgi:F1F0 ATPase subunit 2